MEIFLKMKKYRKQLINRLERQVSWLIVVAVLLMASVFAEEFEVNRHKWLFHFLWIALWSKVQSRKNEKLWEDSFFIAYAIHQGRPLQEIPLMQDICHHTVTNSIETMNDRRTHIS